MINPISQKELQELTDYDPETGVLTWKVSRKGRMKKGSVVGTTLRHHSGKSYCYAGVLNKRYGVHQLAWIHFYGYFPPELDHINGDGTDNRIVNLRLVSRLDNMRNTKLRSNNTSGICGVHWSDYHGKWVARISKSAGKDMQIGRYTDFFEAVCARKNAEKMLGYHTNHGTVRPL